MVAEPRARAVTPPFAILPAALKSLHAILAEKVQPAELKWLRAEADAALVQLAALKSLLVTHAELRAAALKPLVHLFAAALQSLTSSRA